MSRHSNVAVGLVSCITATTLALTGCGSDDDSTAGGDTSEAATTIQVVATDPVADTGGTDDPVVEPTSTAAATTVATEAEEGDEAAPSTNFIEIDGVVSRITIGTCFATPGSELEVLGTVADRAGTDVYAFVYLEDGMAVLSEFNVTDEALEPAWRSGGDGAIDVVLEDKRIAAATPVTAPDGSTAQARFDFTCPG